MTPFQIPTLQAVISSQFGSSRECHITKCPSEVLFMIAHEVGSLRDLLSLSHTCQKLRNACWASGAKVAVIGESAYTEKILAPHPQLMIAGISRQVSEWAIEGRDRFGNLLPGSPVGLTESIIRQNNFERALIEPMEFLTFGGRLVKMSLEDLLSLKELDETYVRPLLNAYKAAKGVTSDRSAPVYAFYCHWIYNELFHRGLENMLRDKNDRQMELANVNKTIFGGQPKVMDLGDVGLATRYTCYIEDSRLWLEGRFASIEREVDKKLKSTLVRPSGFVPNDVTTRNRMGAAKIYVRAMGIHYMAMLVEPERIQGSQMLSAVMASLGAMSGSEVSQLKIKMRTVGRMYTVACFPCLPSHVGGAAQP